MSGLIPQHFIDELLTRIDIVEVINERVPLKKKGREYAACCPFHGEKTPSFYVSPEKQFYHCFGCGVHGTAISFLMEYEHLNFVESIENLADLAGVEVPREENSSRPDKQHDYAPLYQALEKASSFYQQQLRENTAAIDYLRQRGLSGETARDFMLGFAPAGWDNLEKHFGTSYNEKLLLDVGLLSRNDQGKVYDKFRDRIIFPILDRRGRIIAFGGRIMGTGEPKYLNSPESPIFHKGNTLYGLYEARKNNTRLDALLIVEGYMDCIALVQHGIKNVVATLGTATTPDHLHQLFRIVKRVIVCFDGDAAGRKAAWRALEQALPVLRDDLEIDFLFLPDGDDPDSLLQREGAAGFRQHQEQAIPLSSYLVDTLRQNHDNGSMEGRSRMSLEARKLLQTMKSGLLREQLIQRVAELAGLEAKHLMTEPPQQTAQKQRQNSRTQILKMNAMRQALACLLQQPALNSQISEAQLAFIEPLPGGDLLAELVDIGRELPNTNTAVLLEHLRDHPHINALNQLSIWQAPAVESLPQLLSDSIAQLERQYRHQRLEALLKREGEGKLSAEEKQELASLLKS